MEPDVLFAHRFNAIPSEYTKASPQYRIDRIFNHIPPTTGTYLGQPLAILQPNGSLTSPPSLTG